MLTKVYQKTLCVYVYTHTHMAFWMLSGYILVTAMMYSVRLGYLVSLCCFCIIYERYRLK